MSGAIVIAPVLMLLHKAYGFKGEAGAGPDALAAVQANLMASVAKGVFSKDIPWNFAFIGMGVAAAIVAIDAVLESKKSRFRMPVLAVAIGFYLPLELSVPIFFGGLVHWGVSVFRRSAGVGGEKVEGSSRSGLLFASGLITGEALMGIIIAIPVVILKRYEVGLPLLGFGQERGGMLVGAVLLAGVALWLLRVGQDRVGNRKL